LAAKFLTSALKPGMVVTSQRTIRRVYSFGTDYDKCRNFPMKGKAIVLRELTKVSLNIKKQRWNNDTTTYDAYDSFVTKNMLLLSHYKHGLVMYFAHRDDDATWRLVSEKVLEKEDKIE